MAAALAPPPAGGAAPLGPPPLSFLQTLQRNPNVSAACIAGVNEVLQNTTRARMAEYFSGKVAEGLSLILPFVLQDLAFATDKRAGLGHFVEQPPLWSLGVPDSCGYIGLSYCQVDTVPILAKWGVCVPASCTIQDVFTAIFPPATKKLAERIKGRCGPLHADRTLFITREPWPAGAIVTLTLLVVLLAAVLLATAIDVYGNDTGIPWLHSNDADDTASDNHDSHNLVVKLARCFSLRQNYRRLMAPPRSGPFLCLDAVRVLSMLMILLGHTLYYEQSVTGLTNPREAMGFHNRGFLSTGVGLIANGCLFGVDTFLALAGFLAVLLFMKELGKRLPHAHGGRQRASLVTRMALGSYLRRYLRLTPAYAVVLAVFTTLAPMLSSAPPSPTDLFHETGVCARKWWENLLYVNNILSTTYTMCYLPSYFLCIIQQLFLLVPWLALVALRRPRAALALCLLACVGSYVHSFQTAQRQGWRLNGLDRPGFPNFYTNFYTRTFARMPTFLIGGMGAILWHHYGARFQAFLSSGGRWVGALKAWGIVAAGLAILAAAEFGPHDEMAYAPGRCSVFITLCWSAWALGLAMVCAVVFAGRGGPLKTLLELPLWSPLARLVFATYLVHPMTIQVVIASRGGAPAHFSLVYLFYQFVGYSAVSGLAAFLFYVWVEGPFGELERLLFHRPSSRAGGSKIGKKEGTEAAEVEKPASVVVVPVQLTEVGEGSGSTAAAVAQ